MSADFPVALILILGAAIVPLTRGKLRSIYTLALPLVGFAWLLALPVGEYGEVQVLGQTLVLMRVDRLSLLFGYVFIIAAAMMNT